ncbi:tetratricopeptide repeat protein [Thermodesulfobacteriota bacterium]
MSKRNNRSKEFIIKHRDILVCLFLVMATVVVYWQVTNYEFVYFDDQTFVTENRDVQKGITLEGIKFIFKNYGTPLSVISHMLDCELFGLDPGGHHLTSLLLHAASTALLFLVLNSMTGAPWKSAFVSALFALHPLNVESVAWVAERRNVLSTLFWFLTMAAYAWYIRRPNLFRYISVLFCFILGLLSKQMLVTLPFVLLLLDYWPLGRFSDCSSEQQMQVSGQKPIAIKTNSSTPAAFRLILEKIPLIALSILVSIHTLMYSPTILVKGWSGAVSLEILPLKFRIANALFSYVSYIGKMIWPENLAVYYPYRLSFPAWKIALACLLLGCISALAIKTLKQHPWFAVGWFWYMGTLVPVIGMVTIWTCAMADRYAYVPLVGLFIIIAWSVPELVKRWPYQKIVLSTIATIVLAILMAVTWKQVGYWKNSITLFEHTLKTTSNNVLIHHYLGNTLAKLGRTDDAVYQYVKALNLRPDYIPAYNNLAIVLFRKGDAKGAIIHFREALRIKPDYEVAHYNLGSALEKQGQLDEAIGHYFKALCIKPDYVEAHNSLGAALFRKGDIEGAIAHFRKALQINPNHMLAKNNLKKVLMIQQQNK